MWRIHRMMVGAVLAALMGFSSSAFAAPGGLGAMKLNAASPASQARHFGGGFGGFHGGGFYGGGFRNFGGARFYGGHIGGMRSYGHYYGHGVRYSGNWNHGHYWHHHHRYGYPIFFYGGGYYPYYDDYYYDDYYPGDYSYCYYSRRYHARICPDD